MAIDGANAAQAGGSLPGGTGSSVAATIIKNPRLQEQTFTFKQTFQVYTGAYQFESTFPADLTGTTSGNWAGISANYVKLFLTPLAILSPDMLFTFMSFDQFQQLPVFAYAKQCRFKVTPLGYRLPFGTNEAAAGFANSQTLVQCAYGVGFNTQINLAECGYTASEPDLTNVTGVTSTDLLSTVHGADGSIGAIIGPPRHWNNYTVLMLPLSSLNPNVQPRLTDLMSIQNVNDCKGTPIINYKYDYKNGIIKLPFASQAADLNAIQLNVLAFAGSGVAVDNGFNDTTGQLYGCNRTALTNNIPVSPPFFNNDKLQCAAADAVFANGGFGERSQYAMRVEKSHWLSNQLGQQLSPDRPPLVHFGCMPVQSNAPLAATATFSNCAIQWMLECELDVCTNYSYIGELWPTGGSLRGNFTAYLHAFDPVRKTIWNNQHQWFNNQPYVSNRFVVSNTQDAI